MRKDWMQRTDEKCCGGISYVSARGKELNVNVARKAQIHLKTMLKELEEGNSMTGYRTPLGKLMEAFKEKFQEHFYWFPRLMRWNASMGNVASVYRDVLENYI